MFKRLWHRGHKGRFALFRWPSLVPHPLADPAGFDWDVTFNASEYRAWKFGPALKKFVAALRQELPAGASVNLAAHSQGNIVAASALLPRTLPDNTSEPGMRVKNYVMMNAAISASCYDPRFDFVTDFVTADGNTRTPQTLADGGYAEGISPWEPNRPRRGRLQNVTGQFANFYNTLDLALRGWDVNNRDLKPVRKYVNDLESSVQYRFYPGLSDGFHSWLEEPPPPYDPGPMPMRVAGPEGTTTGAKGSQTQSQIGGGSPILPPEDINPPRRPVTDRDECMAFIARSLTYAAGREGDTGNAKNGGQLGPVDYKKGYNQNFGNDHSGLFNRSIQQTRDFYDTLLERFKQPPPQ